MHQLSIRGLEDEALAALKARAQADKASVNTTVLRLLDEALGRAPAAAGRHADLDTLAGTWSAADADEFEQGTAAFREIESSLWEPGR